MRLGAASGSCSHLRISSNISISSAVQIPHMAQCLNVKKAFFVWRVWNLIPKGLTGHDRLFRYMFFSFGAFGC